MTCGNTSDGYCWPIVPSWLKDQLNSAQLRGLEVDSREVEADVSDEPPRSPGRAVAYTRQFPPPFGERDPVVHSGEWCS